MGITNKITLAILAAGISMPAIGQDEPSEKRVHIKTIRIVNGDTTITERDLSEDELHEIEKMRNNHVKLSRPGYIDRQDMPGERTFHFSFSDSLREDRMVKRMPISDSLAPGMRFYFTDSILSRGDFSPADMRTKMKDLHINVDTLLFQELRSLHNGEEFKNLRLMNEEHVLISADSLMKELENRIGYSFSVSDEGGKLVVKQFGPGGEKVVIKKLEGLPGEELSEDIMIRSKDGKSMTRVRVKTTVKIEDMDQPLDEKTGLRKDRNELKLEGLNFYPNPSNGQFTIDFEAEGRQPVVIRITDMNGKEVYQEEVRVNGRHSQQIDLSSHGKGAYLLTLRQGKRSAAKKIVIE